MQLGLYNATDRLYFARYAISKVKKFTPPLETLVSSIQL